MRRTAGAAAVAAVVVALTAPHAAADRRPPDITRVSTAADGTQADRASNRASVTPDGRYVAFSSHATDLVPGGRPGLTETYVRDLRTGRVTAVLGGLNAPVLSADGHYAAYISWGSHTVNVFRADLRTGRQERVDPDAGFDGGSSPSLSGDGRFVAYLASPRHPEDPRSVKVRDMVTGTTETVSDSRPGSTARHVGDPSLSADGRYVAYEDQDRHRVLVRDRTTGALTPYEDNSPSDLVQLSADGRTLVTTSGDDTCVRDLRRGTTRRLPGVRGAAIAPDGRHLLYADGASALHVRDLHSDTDRPVTAQAATAGPGAVSEGGRSVVFSSEAADVVPGDTNGVSDVFVARVR